MIEVSWMWSGVSCICWNSIADVQDTPPPPNHPDPWAEEHHFEATIGWSIQMRNRVPTCSNMFQHVPTCSNMFQHHAMKTGTLLSPILILDPTCKSDITGTATRSTAQFKISVGSPQTIRCRPMHFKVCRIMLHHDIRCFLPWNQNTQSHQDMDLDLQKDACSKKRNTRNRTSLHHLKIP